MKFIVEVNLFHKEMTTLEFQTNFNQISPLHSLSKDTLHELAGKSVSIFPPTCTEEKIMREKTISHMLFPCKMQSKNYLLLWFGIRYVIKWMTEK